MRFIKLRENIFMIFFIGLNLLSSYTLFITSSGRNSSSLLTWSDDGALLAVSAAEGHLADVHVYDVHSGSTFCIIENRANDSSVMSFVPNSSFGYRLVCADQMGHFCLYVCFYGLFIMFVGYRFSMF